MGVKDDGRVGGEDGDEGSAGRAAGRGGAPACAQQMLLSSRGAVNVSGVLQW